MTAPQTLLIASVAALLPAPAAHAAAAPAGGKPVILDDVDRYRVMEPMFECVRVVLSHRGESYTPAYVQGLSGAAFRVSGPCPCAPTCGCAMEPLDLLTMLGYEAEHVALYGPGIDPARDAHKLIARVKAEVRAGRPAIVWHAFTNAEWDVVCGFDEDKRQFLGRGSYRGGGGLARDDEARPAKCLHICPALGAIFVGRKTGKLDARRAELDALAEAVRHARGPRDRFLAELPARAVPWRFRSGLACYEWWVRDLRMQPDKHPNMGDRYCLGVFRSTHRAAGEFLRELAARHAKARAPLERAAEHFTAEADALDKADQLARAKQPKARAQDRSRRLADLLAGAQGRYARGIDAVELALKALDPPRAAAARRPAWVRRDGGKVWVHGVPELAWDRGRHCTFAGSLEAAMKVTERPYTYPDLMGLSGLAFRVRWSNDATKTQWCGSCAVGEMPDEHAAIARLTGWKTPSEWVEAKGGGLGKLRKAMVASIDAGRPVAAYPQTWNVGVVFGYEDGGKTLLMRDYDKPGQISRVPIEKLGPLRTYLGDHVPPPPLADCLREALAAAVRNWKRQRHDGGLRGREYWYGDAALDAWIRDLRNFDKLPPGSQAGLRGIDAWNYLSLHDARRAAASFLREWACVLDAKGRQALDKAVKLYEREAKALEPLLAEKRKPDKEQDFSQTARAGEAEALTEARKLDAAAVAEIAKALAAMTK